MTDDNTVPLTFGVDFDTCVFLTNKENPRPHYVVKFPIPAPTLQAGASLISSSPQLIWENAYGVYSIVFRTPVYSSGNPSTAFERIAKIYSAELPGGSVSYVDSSIILAGGQSVSYYIENENGISNIVTYSG